MNASRLIPSLILASLASTLLLASPKDGDSDPQAQVTQYEGYRLLWHDEFDTDGPPSSCWSYEQGFVRNREEQWYQASNASVRDGLLIIEGRADTVPNPRYTPGSDNWKLNRPQALYTSACLTTAESFHFMYGRLEVRAKIPVATGAWPAIWLLGNKYGWPSGGEIDVMEYYIRDGQPSILANACWASHKPWEAEWNTGITPFTHFTSRDPQWASRFHVWRMDWDKQRIDIYLDGELLNSVDLTDTRNRAGRRQGFNPFSNDEPGFGHYILLNLAMGSSGGPVDADSLPLLYQVDYVRVYQKE